MEPTSVSLIVIHSSNLESTLSFYGALGLNFTQEQHGSGPVHYSYDLGGMVLEIYPNRTSVAFESKAVDSTMLGFKVASLNNTLVDLQALGVAPKIPPKNAEWGRWVNVIDPDGRVVQLTQSAVSRSLPDVMIE